MRERKMNLSWIAAALPLLLMAVTAVAFFTTNLSNTISPLSCALLLLASALTGAVVLIVLAAGWWRGDYPLTRGDILLAAALAGLDIIIPVGLVTLLWLTLRSLSKHGGLIF